MSKIRVGIVGVGWGELQIESFKRAHDYQVVALCDTNTARVEATAKRHKIAQTFSDYRALVSREDVDLVSIATPPDQHETLVTDAIAAGKHVLVEKPVALKTEVAKRLLQAAEQKNIAHAVNFEMRYLPALAYCKELIDENYLGNLLRVDVTMGIERPWGEHGSWAMEEARGGGILMELGAHFIDLMLWWFGDARAVLAEKRTLYSSVKLPVYDEKAKEKILYKMPVSSDDAFWSVLQFARGGDALFNFVTGTRRDMGWTISAYGSLGSLIVQSGQLMGMREGDREIALLPIPKRLELGDNPKDPLMWSMARLAEQMATRIKGDREIKMYPTFQDDIAVARVVDAIRQSTRTRGWVDLRVESRNTN